METKPVVVERIYLNIILGVIEMEVGYQSESRLKMLQGRTKRCICKYCGNKLSLRRLIFSSYEDARIEIFCEHCGRIEFGVEPEIYYSAKYFVDEIGFNLYENLDANEQTHQMNIAKVCEIMAWENKNIGILAQTGFCIPVHVNSNILGECVTLTDEDLIEDEEDVDLTTLKEVLVTN